LKQKLLSLEFLKNVKMKFYNIIEQFVALSR
jgi:hypothetical protein